MPLIDPDGGSELLDGVRSVDEEPAPSEELLDIKYSQCDQGKKTVKLCSNLPRAGLKFEMQPKIDITRPTKSVEITHGILDAFSPAYSS